MTDQADSATNRFRYSRSGCRSGGCVTFSGKPGSTAAGSSVAACRTCKCPSYLGR